MGADDAEGTLERVLQQQWLSGGEPERAELARAGMQVLSQLWSQQQQARHALRLNARLAAVALEEVHLIDIAFIACDGMLSHDVIAEISRTVAAPGSDESC